MSRTLDRALEAARKAQAKAARLQLHEVTAQNARDLLALLRQRDYRAAADCHARMAEAMKALQEGAQEGSE